LSAPARLGPARRVEALLLPAIEAAQDRLAEPPAGMT
jgi:hypothetical protein